NFYFYGNVTTSLAGAPISASTPNGSITGYYYADLVTNNGPVNLTAGTSITLGGEADITSSGGSVALKTGSGALTLGQFTDISTGGGLLWMRGTGVTQSVTDSVLNSGSGKIRIDGGGSAVSLYGRVISSNADTGGTPAILVTNVGGSGNTANFRSVEAQTGTFQVGLIAGDSIVAAAQTQLV
ncbi:hypothetical protein JZU57_01430, partial [bacterium]|nr:hypothetical protein [bacterium]